jgi:hypothetical protein
MRAREWAIAGVFGDPSRYGILDLLAVQVCRHDCGGIAPSAGSDDPLIAADQSTKIYR